jgi:tRNA(Arg) A34 adenosine deaminase TadA
MVMQSAMAANAIAADMAPGDRSDALPVPTLAIRHSPCGMCSGFNLKRDSSLVVVQCDCQWLGRIGYRLGTL